MKNLTKINSCMFNLLIEKEMNNFSVIDARDALLSEKGSTLSKGDARKYIYRQILAFVNKGWLSVTGNHRQKRYNVTSSFRGLSVEPKTRNLAKKKVRNENVSPPCIKILIREKKQYEGDLAITLAEIEEYQSLFNRFPKYKQELLPLFERAREHSAKQMGRINALAKWIQVVQGRAQ
ncbi:hypothetical protein [Vibrio fortis]|uniref:hypothetical protein n=1 Tax=Vibrio fortis TaxID=212667 RepID=UPI0021C47A3F|nr:hypothetical protein [Vibrio fortis]